MDKKMYKSAVNPKILDVKSNPFEKGETPNPVEIVSDSNTLSILNKLKEFIVLTGKIPKVIDLRKGRVELDTSEYIMLFGSYYNALNTVIEINYKELNFSFICDKWLKNRDSILNGNTALMEAKGSIPKQEEYIQYARDFKYYQKVDWIFDDFNTVVKEISVSNEFLTVKFCEDEVIKNIKILAEKIGKTPQFREYIEYAKENNLSTNLKYYNKWNHFVKEAGLVPYNMKYSEQEIVELFIRLKNKLGRVPLKEEFSQELGYPTAFLIDKYFESYNNFLSIQELKQNHREKYTDDELKKYLLDYQSKYGKNPTKFSFTIEKGPNPSIYQKRFGNWTNAIKTLTGENHFKKNQFSYAYKSNHGDIRPSYQEGVIDDLIGEVGLEHEHDVSYKELTKCDKNYTMDFLFRNNKILEVAGIISEKDFNDGGLRLKEKFKKEYLNIIYEKIEIIEGTKYELIIIFKGENRDSILLKLGKISNKFNSLYPIEEGIILDKNIRRIPGTNK